jgi:hypothetical protein
MYYVIGFETLHTHVEEMQRVCLIEQLRLKDTELTDDTSRVVIDLRMVCPYDRLPSQSKHCHCDVFAKLLKQNIPISYELTPTTTLSAIIGRPSLAIVRIVPAGVGYAPIEIPVQTFKMEYNIDTKC